MVKRQRRETSRERQQREHEDSIARDTERLIQQSIAREEYRVIETGRQLGKMLNLGSSYGISAGQFMKKSLGQLSEEMLAEWRDNWPFFVQHPAPPKPDPIHLELDYAALELRVLAYAKGDTEFTLKLFNNVYPNGLDEPPQEDLVQETPAALERKDTCQ